MDKFISKPNVRLDLAMDKDPLPQEAGRQMKDKCGIFAAWNVPEASHINYLGLFALQHRGQEGAGIVATSATGSKFLGHRGEGLVSKVFSKSVIENMKGNISIGHVRYSTAGGSHVKNLQPIWVESSTGELAIAHNGNLTNAVYLRKRLEAEGSVFQTNVDTEVIVHLIAKAKGAMTERIKNALAQIEGAFSLLILDRSEKDIRLWVLKDPHGFRPLVLGRLNGGYVMASETVAFDLIGAQFERELEPGEVLEFSSGAEGMKSWNLGAAKTPAPCVFEWIYFSRPDSIVFGRSVYEMRKLLGEALAEEDLKRGLKADLVMGVPDSGIPAAIGYSQKSGIPFEMGLIRNHYIGRTFIEPHQSIRDFSVKIKQNPLRNVLKGKKIVVVDDSLVRGTTSKKINQFLRDAGVAEIHMRISAPPTISPCYYGIDTPEIGQLIASQKSVEEIKKFVVADSLEYLSVEGVYSKLKPQSSMCDACFSKKYPVAPKDAELDLSKAKTGALAQF